MAEVTGVRLILAAALGCLVLAALPCAAEAEGNMDSIYSVKTFGAKGDGVTDDTAAIQKALDEAEELGGIVRIPAGKFMVKGSLNIPAGVSLKGVAEAPVYSKPLKGSIILSTMGRGKEDGPALFELGNSCAVSGVTVYYPEQDANSIQPYPWTFHLQGFDNTVENVTLINSYNAIRVGPEGNVRHRIRSVYGCALRRGIFVDGCTDIGRIDNVQFHGHWWWLRELKGHPEKVNEFMIKNLEAFIFGRTDWEYVNNTFVFPVNIGYHFIATPSGACNGQFSGIGADYAQRCIVVDEIQTMGLLISNGQFVAFAGDNPIEVVVNASCKGSVRLVNCSFWGPADQNVVSHSQSFVSLNDCYLSSGKNPASGKALVEADGGRLQVRGCSFGTDETSISLKPGLKHAIISENNGVKGVSIQNLIGSEVVISANEPAAK